MELRPFPGNMLMQDESGKPRLKYSEALQCALKLSLRRTLKEGIVELLLAGAWHSRAPIRNQLSPSSNSNPHTDLSATSPFLCDAVYHALWIKGVCSIKTTRGDSQVTVSYLAGAVGVRVPAINTDACHELAALPLETS